MKNGAAAAGSDVVPVTPHSDDAIFFEPMAEIYGALSEASKYYVIFIADGLREALFKHADCDGGWKRPRERGGRCDRQSRSHHRALKLCTE